jgi:hypothetical protein
MLSWHVLRSETVEIAYRHEYEQLKGGVSELYTGHLGILNKDKRSFSIK